MRKKFIGRLAVGVAAVGTVAALAVVGVSGAAGTQTDSIGEAGLVASTTTYTSVAANLTTTPLSQQWVPGVATTSTNADAAGIQLCDNNTGNSAQIGLIRNTSAANSSFSVRYAVGHLTSTADPCVGVGVLTGSSALPGGGTLTAIPQGDTVALSIKAGHKTVTTTTYTWVWHWAHWYKHWYKVNGHWHYKWVWHWVKWYKVSHNSKVKHSTITFQAEDTTSGYVAWTSPVFYLPNGQVYYEAGAGAQRQSAHLAFADPLPYDVADFTGVQFNGTGVLAQTGGTPFDDTNTVAVQSAAGVASQPQVAPGPLAPGSEPGPFPELITQIVPVAGQFSVYTGPEVS